MKQSTPLRQVTERIGFLTKPTQSFPAERCHITLKLDVKCTTNSVGATRVVYLDLLSQRIEVRRQVRIAISIPSTPKPVTADAGAGGKKV